MRRGFVEDGPEAADELDGFGKVAEVDGFYDVGVDAESVGKVQVGFGAGRSHHDDGDTLEAMVGFHASKEFEAGHARHFIIEKDDNGASGLRTFMNSRVQNLEGFDAIMGDEDGIGEIAGFQSGSGKLNIVEVVFNEQHGPDGIRHGERYPPGVR
jgi:hypothetical protein